MDVAEDVFFRRSVPGDGSCAFWSVSLAYLLPVKNHESLFIKRFEKLFGERDRQETLNARDLIIDKDLSNVFRRRVMEQMMKQEEEVLHRVTVNDIFEKENETFISNGTFSELFRTTFPSLTPLVDLDKFTSEQLNDNSIKVMKEKLGSILDNMKEMQRINFHSYLESMRNGCCWVGEREVRAIQSLLQCQIFIFNDANSTFNIDNNSVNICLFKANAGHYDFGLVKPEAVIEAITKLNYKLAHALVKIGVSDANYRYKNEWTLLHFATLTNNFQNIIKRLVWQGADTSLVTKNKNTPLQMANDFELDKAIASLQSLTNKNKIASPKETNTQNQSSNHKHGINEAKLSIKPLTDTVIKKQTHCMNITLDCPNQVRSNFFLDYCFNLGLNFVHALIERRIDNVNFINMNLQFIDNSRIEFFNWSPLHYAAAIGNLEIVKELIEKGRTEVDIKDHKEGTPLKRAAKYGHYKVVKYLKENGADVNAKNNASVSVLSCAARNGYVHIIHYLIENGAKINALDIDGISPVHQAVQCGQVNALKSLVELKADVNIPDNNNKTPLHKLIENGKWDMVKLSLENGALLIGLSGKRKQNMRKKLISGSTNIQFSQAISLGNVELLKILLLENQSNLEKPMFKAYNKLKLMNVPLSHDMCMFTEDKLMNNNFFIENQLIDTKTKVDNNAENVKMRIVLTAKCINALEDSLKNNDNKIDDIFLFNGKCIAKNMQILKRQLRWTYDILPWEEMQFYLITFLLSYIEPNQVEAIANLTLHETRLIKYLNTFRNIFESVHVKDIFHKCNKTINRNRGEIKLKIITSTPQFKDLYDEFEHIRDMHSLKRIKKYISIACSVDSVKNPAIGQLAIERSLQVTGECLKNTLESPNLSENVQNMLLIYAPRNVRYIITSLRDSLSHVKQLVKIEDTKSTKYFMEIQNDLKKLKSDITYINFRKKCAVVKSFLERIISSNNLEDMWVDSREMFLYNICFLKNENNTCLDKIACYLRKLKSLLRKPTDFQKRCIEDIEKFINQEKKNKEIEVRHREYFLRIEVLIDLIKTKKNVEDIQRLARTILSAFVYINYSENDNSFNHVSNLAAQLRSSIEEFDEAQELIQQIMYTIKLDAENIQNIEEFNQLFKLKNNGSKIKSNNYLDEEIRLWINKLSVDIDIKNQMKEEFESKKDVHKCKSMLIKFFNEELLTDEIPDEKQFQNWCEKINLKLAENKTHSALYYNNRETDDKKFQDIIQQINQKTDDSYGKVVKAFKQEKSTNDISNEISQFLKSFKSLKNTKFKFQEISSQTEPNIIFFKKLLFKNMKTMDTILNKMKNDSELLICLRSNKDIRAAMEMLMLRITEILGNLCLFQTNPTFLDESIPVLIGKNLRNYLAHSDLLIDLLSIDHLKSIIYHIRSIQNNSSETRLIVYDGNKRVGKEKVENVKHLEKSYEMSLKLLIKQKTIITTVKKNNNIKDLRRFLNNEIELKYRNFNGWSLLFYTAQTDNLEMFTYLINHNTNIYYRDKLGYSLLYYLAKFGTIKIIKYLVEQKLVDPNVTTHHGVSLLHISAKYGQHEFANFLLTNNVDANVRDKLGGTAILLALMNGHVDVVSLLIEFGADINNVHFTGTSLLHYAALDGHTEILKLLIKGKNFKVDLRNYIHQTPLHLACMEGHANAVALLLKNNANINALSNLSFTPLHYAAQEGHQHIVTFLLENKATINLVSNIGETALHVAAMHGHLDVVNLLLEKGFDVKAQTKDSNTPLHFATSSNHLRVVKLLVCNYRADVNAANVEGLTPFHKASEVGSIEVVKLMLDYGANINNCVVNSDHTPLHLAAQSNTKQVVELLLQRGANINAHNEKGVTPIHSAMFYRQLDNIKLLLENKANIEINEHKFPLAFAAISNCYQEGLNALINYNRDIIDQQYDNGNTLLHFATALDNQKIVEFLLKHKANVGLLDRQGQSALHVAVALGRKNVVELMLRLRSRILDLRANNDVTPLQVACIHGHLDLVEVLIEKGAEINIFCVGAWTALHFAVTNNHPNVVEYLLNNGANVNALLIDQSTPLHLVMRPELRHLFIPISQHKNEKLNRIKEFKVVECLIKYGAKVNAIDCNKIRPLQWAAMNGLHEMVSILCQNNASLDDKDIMGRTALQWAGESSDKRCMVYLMMFGADTRGFIDKHFTEFY